MHRLRVAIRQWWMVVVAVVGAVILGWGSYQIGSLQAQADALSIALERQRGQAEASGQRPVAPPASEIRENPQIVVETQPVPPSDEQVDSAVAERLDAAVARFFEANGVDIPPQQLALELAAYLERNPPAAGDQVEQGPAGEPPTPEQIAAAAERWLADNVELIRGPAGDQGPAGGQGVPGQDGADGEDGRTPTPEKLAALIRDELAKLTLPLCPAGWSPETVQALTADRAVQTILVCVPN